MSIGEIDIAVRLKHRAFSIHRRRDPNDEADDAHLLNKERLLNGDGVTNDRQDITCILVHSDQPDTCWIKDPSAASKM